MDTFYDERDLKILEKDKYTFFVLRRIIQGECELLLTDHERLIICFTGLPFPVWIYTPDDASEDELERAYCLAKEHSFIDGNHNFNVKYSFAEYMIARAKTDGIDLSLKMNMYAYDNPDPVEPFIRSWQAANMPLKATWLPSILFIRSLNTEESIMPRILFMKLR